MNESAGYLSTQDVAAILDKDTQAVRRLIWSGRLPCKRRVHHGTRCSYLVTPAELRAYLETYDRARLPFLPAA